MILNAMNIPRLIISVIVLAVFFAIYNTVVHGVMLGHMYKETEEFWRPEDEIMSRWWIQFVSYVPIAIGFATIWALAFPNKGAKCGAIYGFLIGLISVGGLMINTVFTPTPDQVILPWIASGIIGPVLSGVVVALVYKPKAA